MNSVSNNLILELHVPDFELVKQFYLPFGFKVIHDDPTSGGGSDLGYLVLAREDTIGRTLINFYGNKPKVAKHAHFNQFPSATPRGYEVEITIPVSDVASFWEDMKEKIQSTQIAQPLTTKRWGQQDFRVIDPFGFYIRFTELVDWGQ